MAGMHGRERDRTVRRKIGRRGDGRHSIGEQRMMMMDDDDWRRVSSMGVGGGGRRMGGGGAGSGAPGGGQRDRGVLIDVVKPFGASDPVPDYSRLVSVRNIKDALYRINFNCRTDTRDPLVYTWRFVWGTRVLRMTKTASIVRAPGT